MNQDTTTTTLDVPDFFRDTINRNSLCANVGREMFCRYCDDILDWRRSVEISAWKGDRCALVRVMCARCFDDPKANEALRDCLKDYRMEVIDGRELRKRMP